jgi:hypothetical protein
MLTFSLIVIFLSIGFILFAIQAEAILKSTFKSVMGRQFLRKCFGFPSSIYGL